MFGVQTFTSEDLPLPWNYLDSWAYRVLNTPDSPIFTLTDWCIAPPNTLDGETTNATAACPFPIGTYCFDPSVPVTEASWSGVKSLF